MKTLIDREGIKSIIPHRDPFLFVDKIVAMGDTTITGVKNVTPEEPFFKGHFPGHPIMPGVLIVEALAQTCGVLALRREENHGKLAFFVAINNAKFRKPVLPGDVLMLEVEITKWRSRIVQAHGIAKVDGETTTEADLLFSVADKK